jgi:hypothetical protein
MYVRTRNKSVRLLTLTYVHSRGLIVRLLVFEGFKACYATIKGFGFLLKLILLRTSSIIFCRNSFIIKKSCFYRGIIVRLSCGFQLS